MSRSFRKLRIASVREETDEARVIAFRPEDRSAFAFRPGQYLTLRAEIDGQAEQRCYSICSAPGAPEIEVAIKRVPGGRFSAWAHAALAPGAEIDVMPPEGRFGRRAEGDGPRSYLAIAAGSGVTPILSLACTILATEPESQFALVYGNRTLASIMFREALDDLKDRYLARFSLIHLLSREAQDVDLLNGRIDGAKLARLARAGLIAPAQADAVFLCGPGDMLDAATEALTGLGVAAARIQTERFLPTPGAPSVPPPPATPTAAGQRFQVTAIVDGASRVFAMGPDDVSAVLAAERAGVELPSSCRGGMCCTCRAKVAEGAVDMAVNYSLEAWEIEAGFVLACQSRPTTPRVTLDFDAV